MSDQRKNPLKEEMAQSLKERVQKYRNDQARVQEHLQKNPNAPEEQRNHDRKIISIGVARLESVFEQILPFISRIRNLIIDPLEQSKLAASYLLLGKIAQTWRAVFLLMRDGFHYETMELIRSIYEAKGLVFVFMNGDNESSDLTKWLSGEIIANERARAKMHEYMNTDAAHAGVVLPIRDMMDGVYAGLSKYSHASYAAILDSFDVYQRDFDFEKTASLHYVRSSSIPYAANELEGTIVILKGFYQVLGDTESYKKLDQILRQIAPEMYNKTAIKQTTEAMIKKFPQNKEWYSCISRVSQLSLDAPPFRQGFAVHANM